MLPLFFLISGFFFNPNKQIIQFVFNRIKGIILPYISLGIIASLFYIPFNSFDKVYNLIFKDLFSWQTLWFLPVIFFSNIIAFLIIKYFKFKYLFFFVTFMLGAVASLLNYYNINIWLQLEVVPIGSCLCLLGYYIYNNSNIINIRKPNKLWFIALPIYIFYVCYTNYHLELRLNRINPIISLFFCTLLGLLFITVISHYILKHKYSRYLLNFIGKNTIIILAIHMPIFFNMQHFIRPLFNNQFFYKIIEMVAIFIGSIVFCIIVNKYLYFLIGKNRYEKNNNIPSVR